MMVRQDMTGWIMSEHGIEDSCITVIGFAGRDKGHRSKWKCMCVCGREFIADGNNLKRGNTKSCGCLRKRKCGTQWKKQNEFTDTLIDEHGKYIVGYTTNNHNEFYFDASDYDVIKQFCWIDYIGKNGWHALKAHVSEEQMSCFNISKTTIFFHQLIGCSRCDHIDRNPMNNRRYNLRQCTHAENSRNVSVRNCNKSGVTGVSWYNNRWNAEIRLDGKRYYLGRFTDKTQAIIARLKKERELFGEFAPQKELYERYLK